MCEQNELICIFTQPQPSQCNLEQQLISLIYLSLFSPFYKPMLGTLKVCEGKYC